MNLVTQDVWPGSSWAVHVRVARANGEDLAQSAHSIHPSLYNVFFVIDFVYLKC